MIAVAPPKAAPYAATTQSAPSRLALVAARRSGLILATGSMRKGRKEVRTGARRSGGA